MLTRSPRLAADLARLLNGEKLPTLDLGDPSPIPRYTVSPGTHERWVVVADQFSGTAAYGGGDIAVTPSEELARRAAALLNEVDPAVRRRARRWFGRR